jgi:hypothetical protein
VTGSEIEPLVAALSGKPGERFDALQKLYLRGEAFRPELKAALKTSSGKQATALAGLLVYLKDQEAFEMVVSRAQVEKDEVAQSKLVKMLGLQATSSGSATEWGQIYDLTTSSKGAFRRQIFDLLLERKKAGDDMASLTGKGAKAVETIEQELGKRLLSSDIADVTWAMSYTDLLKPAMLASGLDTALQSKDWPPAPILKLILDRMDKGEKLLQITGQGSSTEERIRDRLQEMAQGTDEAQVRWILRYAKLFKLTISDAMQKKLASTRDEQTKGD